ncbi:peroxidase family protein, partial [Actinoplanes sp. KI2]|uniref:peroxidase family protein n=1 Tax=Actinoplanes sp. KI2 TaxID=2983315 RepID=UPI0021D5FA1B
MNSVRSKVPKPLTVTVVTTVVMAGLAMTGPAVAAVPFEVQTLDGTGNNVANPTWGKAGTPYARVAAARYADGISQEVAGPNARYVSNRVFNDINQNVFSER